MPSIREMFTPQEVEGEGATDFNFDLDQLLSETDRAIGESTRLRVPELEGQQSSEGGDTPDPVQPPLSESAVEPEPEEEEEPGMGAGAPETEGVPAAITGAMPDPLGLLPPDRQAALLAMDRVFQEDPAKREAVLKALSAEPQVPSYVEPSLPEQIDPDSVEAMLWKQNVETQRQVAQIANANRDQQETFAKQQAATAAERAGATFSARYDGKLTQDDVMAIARHAGQTGVAARFANGSDNLTASFDQALEHVLWTNENFRSKVLGTEITPVEPGKTPEATTRKRKLTALSSSASPVSGPSPARERLESDPVRGRLTPQSRLKAVQELATGIARQRNEGTF